MRDSGKMQRVPPLVWWCSESEARCVPCEHVLQNLLFYLVSLKPLTLNHVVTWFRIRWLHPSTFINKGVGKWAGSTGIHMGLLTQPWRQAQVSPGVDKQLLISCIIHASEVNKVHGCTMSQLNFSSEMKQYLGSAKLMPRHLNFPHTLVAYC
jgi:hypothetical protein